MLENQKATFTSYIKNYEDLGHNEYAHENKSESERNIGSISHNEVNTDKNQSKSHKSDNMNNNGQTSDLRRSQSMKSADKHKTHSTINENIRNYVEHSGKMFLDQEPSEIHIHNLRNNPDEKSHRRVNSQVPPSIYKSVSSGSPVLIRRRYSFASGSSPYAESSKRKLTSHDLIHNCGRRILKAVEEGKILAHSCERRLGDGNSVSDATYDAEDFIPTKIVQNNEDICDDLSVLPPTSEDKILNSTENLTINQFTQLRRDSLKEFDTPLKVYNKKKSSHEMSPQIPKENQFLEVHNVAQNSNEPLQILTTKTSAVSPNSQISSCQAIRTALSSLYNVEDFRMVKIGEGFFSEVFKVVHKGMGKVMVLKRNKHRANRNNMLKEVQLMNTLKHENILKYEGACVADGQLHALVEYINGGSLEQLILGNSVKTPDSIGSFDSINGSNNDYFNQCMSSSTIQYSESTGAQTETNSLYLDLPWSTRISLAQDITNGLSYLHSKGIFHRDLTSKNVLIRKEGQSEENENDIVLSAVVADFGLAANIPEDTNDRLLQVGSPYWMSPECLRGQFYGHKSDVFSFGIVLCELIARCEADPDILPRTENFGVDYLVFSEKMVDNSCPAEFLKIAFSCVTIDPVSRPEFETLYDQLSELLSVFAIQSLTKCNSYSDDTSVYNNTLSHGCRQTTPTQTETNNFVNGKHLPNSEHTSLDKPEQWSAKVASNLYCSEMTTEPKENITTIPLSSGSDNPMGQNSHTPQTRRFPVRSRRCVTQRDFPKCSPSEYARHHSPSGSIYLFTDGKAKPVHITPFAIGEEMSRLDPHYIPSPAPGVNPFAMLPRRLTEDGRHGKIFGPKDLFCSCFELSSGLNMTNGSLASNSSLTKDPQSATNGNLKEPLIVDGKRTVVPRRAISLIQHPSNIMDSLEQSDDDASKDISSTKAQVESK